MSVDKNGNFKIVKGTTFNPELVYLQPDGVTPIDLTGCEPILEIRENVNSTLLLALSISSGITIQALEGKILPYISAAQTAAFSVNKAVYEIFLIWPLQNNLKKSLFNGPKTITFEESVIG